MCDYVRAVTISKTKQKLPFELVGFLLAPLYLFWECVDLGWENWHTSLCAEIPHSGDGNMESPWRMGRSEPWCSWLYRPLAWGVVNCSWGGCEQHKGTVYPCQFMVVYAEMLLWMPMWLQRRWILSVHYCLRWLIAVEYFSFFQILVPALSKDGKYWYFRCFLTLFYRRGKKDRLKHQSKNCSGLFLPFLQSKI